MFEIGLGETGYSPLVLPVHLAITGGAHPVRESPGDGSSSRPICACYSLAGTNFPVMAASLPASNGFAESGLRTPRDCGGDHRGIRALCEVSGRSKGVDAVALESGFLAPISAQFAAKSIDFY